MTYRLYNRPGSGGFVVEAAFALADEPFELVELYSKAGTPLAESFRETNPWKQLPTLILPDGSILTETAAILIHLAAVFPGKGLALPARNPGPWVFFALDGVCQREPIRGGAAHWLTTTIYRRPQRRGRHAHCGRDPDGRGVGGFGGCRRSWTIHFGRGDEPGRCLHRHAVRLVSGRD